MDKSYFLEANKAAKAILKLYDGDRMRWTQGAEARMAAPYSPLQSVPRGVDPNYKHAACWCLKGALLKVKPPRYSPFMHVFFVKTGQNMIDFNDTQGRKFSEIIAALELVANAKK
jgi:hypothetical protein